MVFFYRNTINRDKMKAYLSKVVNQTYLFTRENNEKTFLMEKVPINLL